MAVNALDSAVAHLSNYVNYPAADKTYFILSAFENFKTSHGVDMAIFSRTDMPAWSYANVGSEAYCWKFVESKRTAEGKRAFYIQNNLTELYMGSAEATGEGLFMVDEPSETQAYSVDVNTNGTVSLCDGRYSSGRYLHFNSHGNGAGVYGSLIYWGTSAASEVRIVESEMYIQEYLRALNIENIDVTDEYVAPVVKGTFDLFGRRIDTPSTTGIYIIDGKKYVIKK